MLAKYIPDCQFNHHIPKLRTVLFFSAINWHTSHFCVCGRCEAMSYKLFLAALMVLLLAALVSVAQIKIVSPLLESQELLPVPTIDSNKKQNQRPDTLPIFGAFGPESLAFDRDGGGPYTGVSDGRIIKWLGNESRWIDFAVTTPNRTGCESSSDHVEMEPKCGRPLGLCFNQKSGDLYIADAHMGLLVVGSEGGLATPLAQQAQGIPLKFTNGVDVDQRSGVVYFTDSSKIFERRDYVSVILNGDRTGRLLKFDPKTNQVTVLLENLMFPNGVALSKKGDFLLVAETTNCRIFKFWIEPSSKAGLVEAIAQLPGFPDNIKRNQKGEFWVAINSRRGKIFNWILSNVWLGNLLTKIPFDLTKAHSLVANFNGCGLAVKLSENGDVLEILEDKKGETWKYSSEVAEEENGYLWIGSVKLPYAVKLKISG